MLRNVPKEIQILEHKPIGFELCFSRQQHNEPLGPVVLEMFPATQRPLGPVVLETFSATQRPLGPVVLEMFIT